MSTHLSKRQIEQYSERKMSPAELLLAGDHLAACLECRSQVAAVLHRPATLAAALREDFARQAREPLSHLDYQQLEAYVDDRLDETEREIVDSHAAVCASCKEELRDLFAFKETLAERAPANVERDERPAAFQARVKAWWHRPALAARFGLAAGMAALLLIALVAWLAFRKTQDSPVVRLQPTPSPTASQTPNVSQTPTPQVSPSPTNGDATPTPTPEAQPTTKPSAVPPVDNPMTAPALALNDNGERIILNREGQLEGLENASVAERQAIRRALLNGRIETPAALEELKGRTGTLMGGTGADNSFYVIGPAGTIVLSDRPTFHWRALPGATSYTVKIYDTDFNAVASSDAMTATEWTPARPLAAGRVYTWQVVAVKDGQEVVSPAPPAREARFKVLGAAETQALKRSLEESGNSHLARGLAYARAGILDEAEGEFAALSRENPQSNAARKLLNNVRAMRRAK